MYIIILFKIIYKPNCLNSFTYEKNENINKIEQNSTIITSKSNIKNAVIPEPFTLLCRMIAYIFKLLHVILILNAKEC